MPRQGVQKRCDAMQNAQYHKRHKSNDKHDLIMLMQNVVDARSKKKFNQNGTRTVFCWVCCNNQSYWILNIIKISISLTKRMFPEIIAHHFNAGMAVVAVAETLLAARVKHNIGSTMAMLIGSIFLAKHFGIYTAHLNAIPFPILAGLGVYLVALCYIRIRTLKPTRGSATVCILSFFFKNGLTSKCITAYVRGFPVQVYKPRGCTRVATGYSSYDQWF